VSPVLEILAPAFGLGAFLAASALGSYLDRRAAAREAREAVAARDRRRAVRYLILGTLPLARDTGPAQLPVYRNRAAAVSPQAATPAPTVRYGPQGGFGAIGR
jgi:hypothetical protein